MIYRVELSARAREELKSNVAYIAQRAPRAAERWHRGIVLAMRSLERQPRRFAIAPESSNFPFEIRQMLFGRKRNHRVIYTINEEAVVVLTIRHAAQQELDPNDF